MKLFSESLPFYRGNLHTHTTCSDGKKTPKECMELYRSLGYDFLSLTDHRAVTVPDPAEIPEGLVMIPGIELDYMLENQCVHLQGLGMGITAENMKAYNRQGNPQDGIDLIRASGSLAMLNHPAWSLNDPQYICSLHGLFGVEVWNSVSTLPYNPIRADSSSLLDVVACNGVLLPMLANDDTHFYGSEVAQGWNMVQAEEKTPEAILQALAAGKFYATQGPEIHQVEITDTEVRVNCSPASAVVFFSNLPWAPARGIVGDGLTEAVYKLHAGEKFVRAQVLDAKGKSAWMSPVKVPIA